MHSVYAVIFISVLILLIFTKKLKTFVNPVTYFCIGLISPMLVFSILNAVLSSDSLNFRVFLDVTDEVYFDAAIAYGGAVLVFSLPWIFVSPLSKIEKTKLNYSTSPASYAIKRNNIFLGGLFVFSLVAFASFMLGTLPIFSMVMGRLDARDLNEILKSLPFGLLAIINSASLIYFLYLSSFILSKKIFEISKLKLLSIITVAIFIVSWQGKRQQLLFILIVVVSSYFHRRRIDSLRETSNIKKFINIFILLIFFLIFFITIDFVRYQEDGSDVLVLLGYFTWPFLNVLSVASELGLDANLGKLDGGLTILAEILPSRFGGGDIVEYTRDFLFEPTSPSGYLVYWWLDGGILFVLFGVLLLSLSSLWAYKKKDIDENRANIYMLLLWCCITSGVYTHFISINFFWIPFLFFYTRVIFVK